MDEEGQSHVPTHGTVIRSKLTNDKDSPMYYDILKFKPTKPVDDDDKPEDKMFNESFIIEKQEVESHNEGLVGATSIQNVLHQFSDSDEGEVDDGKTVSSELQFHSDN